jgi:hypothetical protein
MTRTSGVFGMGRAAAELIIIILGVLIALAVDNWNSDRAERTLEKSYLTALGNDLRADSTFLAGIELPALAQKDSALAVVAPIARGLSPIPVDTVGFLRVVSLAGRLGAGAFSTKQPTYDELLSTGRLRLIQSQELRAQLVAHYTASEVQKARTNWRTPGYPMMVHEFYPAELRESVSEAAVREFGVARALQIVRSDRFERVMNQELNLLFFLRTTAEQFLLDTNALLRLVDEERARLD